MNNVYMLKTHFTPESIGDAEGLRNHVECSLRKALGARDMADQFSRVSLPCADEGMQMAVVCTEDAAEALRAMARTLRIESLTMHEGRTSRLHAVSPDRIRYPVLRTPAALRA